MHGPQPGDPRVIFAAEPYLGGHPSDIWRVTRPSFELHKRGYDAAIALPDSLNALEQMLEIRPDVLVLPRLTPDSDQFRRYVDALHAIGCAVVLDWDDSPNCHPRVHDAPTIKWTVKNAWECLRMCDGITATTPDLVDHIRAQTDKPVYWLPNLIAPEQWDRATPDGRPDAVAVGVMGGSSHADDWDILRRPWLRLAERFPNVHFVCVGWEPTWMRRDLPKERYHFRKWETYYGYPNSARWIDIGCAPLVDIPFNHYKSPIKWMEYTLAGAATVVSPLLYGTWVNGTAAIAQNEAEWFDALAVLVGDAELRKNLQASARSEVLEYHTFSDERLRAWIDVYRSVYRGVFGHDATGHGDADSSPVGVSGGGSPGALLRGLSGELPDTGPERGDAGTAESHLRHAARLPAGLTRLPDIAAHGQWAHAPGLERGDQREVFAAQSRITDVLSVRRSVYGDARFGTNH